MAVKSEKAITTKHWNELKKKKECKTENNKCVFNETHKNIIVKNHNPYLPPLHAYKLFNPTGSEFKYIITENNVISDSSPEAVSNNFWWMIWENDVRTIVMLEDMNVLYCPYFPSKPFENLTFDISKTIHKEFYREINFKIIKKVNKTIEEKKLRLFEYSHWPKNIPNNKNDIFNLIEDFKNIENNEWVDVTKHKLIVVHCKTGTGRAGIFVSLAAMMEKIVNKSKIKTKKLDSDSIDNDLYEYIDISLAHRPLFLENQHQYNYLLETLEFYKTCVTSNNKPWQK
jgi:protein tyrosine phosphatase